MRFDDWWAGLTQAERKVIGASNAKFVWGSAVIACAAIAKQWDEEHPTSNYGGCIADTIKTRMST